MSDLLSLFLLVTITVRVVASNAFKAGGMRPRINEDATRLVTVVQTDLVVVVTITI